MTDAPTDAWSPARYERFKSERAQPFHDLLALVKPAPAMRVVDLGCGTGELTAHLHRHLAARETIGVDSSEAMLAKSGPFEAPLLTFRKGDLALFRDDAPFDLVFSNAALQWADDHPAVLRHMAAQLAPSGQLAIQVPANHDTPSHQVAAMVASEEPYKTALHGHVRKSPVLHPEHYAEILHALGFPLQHVRLQVYGHVLDRRDGVVEWVKGTLLTDYESRLTPALYASFLERYRDRLLPLLDEGSPFFYPFKRILLWARRA